MRYDTYKLLNIDDFEAADIPSRELNVELEGVGLKNILVTKAGLIGVLYEGIFLCVDLNGENPFFFEDHAAFVDANRDLWLWIKSEDQG